MDIHSGLIGYWSFDERSGARIVDRSGFGSHGELVNADRAEGLYGGAVALSGRDDSHVSVASSTALNNIGNQLTVSAWAFSRVAPQGFRVVVSRQVGDLLHPDQFYLGYGPENGQMHYKWHLGTDDGGTLREGDVYAGTPLFDRWVHLLGTYDGERMRLYVDGAEIGSAAITGRIRVDNNPVTIGGEENGPDARVVDGEFNGLIDEVRIYNRALSAAEVRALFAMDSL